MGLFGLGKRGEKGRRREGRREYAAAIVLPPPPDVPERAACTHGAEKEPFIVSVRGHEIRMKDADWCRSCIQQYLEDYSTTCASCGLLILHGMPVGQTWVGAPHPFTHLTRECCDSGGHYCGVWGVGRLMTLHEIDPGQFPEGARSQASHVMHTGVAFPSTVR